ncbi:MAG: hypothetical protein Q4F72_04965 [Desulfovibrionaceae bacterium]|nr:hypothetical protein [Desulfovibrionaceae bacterium]
MSSLRKFARLLLTVSLILSMGLLAGCGLKLFDQKQPQAPARPQPAPIKGTTVALVLPRNTAPLANAVIGGARLGETAQKGTKNPVRVRVIYADGAWLQEIAKLPERTIIGGPMTPAAYQQMKAAGIMDKRVVFAFLPQLPSGDEGQVAWRFFPSQEDQTGAVASFCVDELGITSMASFGPNSAFANAMTDRLEQALAGKGVVLQRITADGDPMAWGQILKPYVNPTTNESNGTLQPQTPFESVFLPVAWRRLQSVNTAFGSNGEERLVMFGTMLWDDANTRGNQNADRFVLAAWPSPFLRDRAPATLANSNVATFWGALGYDFTRFAARLGLSGRPSSSEVTAAARQLSSMSFSMAPLSYDSSGMASQQLYMVQAGQGGPQQANAGNIRAARDAAVQRVEERATSPSAGQPSPQSSGPIMRANPNSSYRLSLPGAMR